MLDSVLSLLCTAAALVGLVSIPIALQYLLSYQHDGQAARRRRLARVRTRKCLGCGYDVRASDFRCPECGRIIVSEAAVMGWSPPNAEAVAAALQSMQDEQHPPAAAAAPLEGAAHVSPGRAGG